MQLEERLDVAVPEAARRLVEHEHAAAGRRARARSRRAAATPASSSPTGRIRRDVAMPELARAPRAPSRASGRDRRSPAAGPRRRGPARRRGRCSPSRVRCGASDSSWWIIATPARRAVERIARRVRDAVDAHLARIGRSARRRESPSACSCRRRSGRRARTPRRRAPRNRRRRARRSRRTRLRDAAHLEAQCVAERRAGYGFSHFDRSGCSSSFASGSFICVARDQAHAGVDAALDRLAFEMRHHRLHAEIAHVHRILQHEPVEVPVAPAL